MKSLYPILLCFFLFTSATIAQNKEVPEKPEQVRLIKQSLMNDFPPASLQEQITNHPNNTSYKNTLIDFGTPPQQNWVNQFGGTGEDFARDLVSDPAGNIYITGSFAGNISIGVNDYTSQGQWDSYVAKFSTTGELTWFMQFYSDNNDEAHSYDIHRDAAGKVYVTGKYTGDLAIGSHVLAGSDDERLFMAVLDSDGTVILARNDFGYWGHKIDTDAEGNIYVMEYSHPYDYFTVLIKWNENGEMQQWFEIGHVATDMKISGDAIYFSGNIYHSGSIGDFYFTPTSYQHAFIAKSNLAMDFEWAYMAEHMNYGSSYGRSLYVSPEGSVFMAGDFFHDIIWGEFELIGPNGYVLRCSQEGNFEWANIVAEPPEYTHNIRRVCGNDESLFISYDENLTSLSATDGSILHTASLDYTPSGIWYCSGTEHLNSCGSKNELIVLSKHTELLEESWLEEIDGNTAYSEIIAMGTDQYGFLYVYGYASNTIDYFGTTLEQGLFLAKQAGDGSVIWMKQFSMSPASFESFQRLGSYLVTDTLANAVYIAGMFNEPMSIPQQADLEPAEDGSIFILKYGIHGTFQWALQEDFNGNKLCLATDPSSNLLISGVYYGSIQIGNTTLPGMEIMNVFVAKYNPGGNFLWAIGAGGDDYSWNGLINADADGNILLSGEFTASEVTIGDYSLTLEEGEGNILLAKLDPFGNVLWATSKAASTIAWGDYYCWPTSLQTDALGNTYIKGWFKDSTYFDNILLTNPYHYQPRFSYFIAKFDTDGNTIWANPINEHHWHGFDYNQMSLDADGNVYFGAQIRDTIHFGEDYTYIPENAFIISTDLFVARYSSDGILDWVKIITGGRSNHNYINSVAVYNENSVFIGGGFYGEINVGGIPLKSNNIHGYITLLGEAYFDIHDDYVRNTGTVSVFPNPFLKETILTIDLTRPGDCLLKIRDSNGKQVFEKQLQVSGEPINVRVNGEGLSAGIYYYSVETAHGELTGKMVKGF